MSRTIVILVALLLISCGGGPGPPGDRALELRNRGIAELENERPERAELTFRELRLLVTDDPLGPANLAVALLRQQKFPAAEEAIAQALALAPERPDLLAIQAEVLRWSGRLDEALTLYTVAAGVAPDDVEIQFSTLDVARSVRGVRSEPVAAESDALQRLVRLRPDNLVVLLGQLRDALTSSERARASEASLRIRELMWQAPAVAQETLAELLEALNAGRLEDARASALRLENVLKTTPIYQQGRRELARGVQGVPVQRFTHEATPTAFGDPVPVTFVAKRLSDTPLSGAALSAADFDGDRGADLIWVSAGIVSLARGGSDDAVEPVADALTPVSALAVVDLDNDGALDVLLLGADGIRVYRGSEGSGGLTPTDGFGLAEQRARSVAAFDFDIEGDLDLAIAGGDGLELLRNSLMGPLVPVGEHAFAGISVSDPRQVIASDLDRDGDLDLAVAHEGGIAWLDNLRQGRFIERGAEGGLGEAQAARALVSADLDNDGLPELIAAGRGLEIFHNRGGRFVPWPLRLPELEADFDALLAFDADNDGRLDLALAGPETLAIFAQQTDGGFLEISVREGPAGASALVAADFDRDGDLDLAVGGPEGVHRLGNEGGNRNHWLAVSLRGLNVGNSKNNVFGLGTTLEVFGSRAYQFREAQGDVTHFGLGDHTEAEILRAVWTNGVPQNRLGVGTDQRLVEEQVLKGSCPFLYAWDGERADFVTDLLWNAPAGLPLAPGIWAAADPQELVRVDRAQPRDGRYDLRITEELWEAAFFDMVRLWVVDHPPEVEVASSLRIVPGAEAQPERVLAARNVRPVVAAWDGHGRDRTGRVRARDEVYADGWVASPYQGVAAAPWTFAFDLGEAPGRPVRLLLDGWIFPADASLNLAVAQRDDLPFLAPRLEVEVDGRWESLMPVMGHPPGKTKTMVVDTPPLPAGAHKLRIVSNLWLAWDRIAWTTDIDDHAAQLRATLVPTSAQLHYRGFSAPRRAAPNAPHGFDYGRVSTRSPWLPFPGRYTRYGDVGELLASPDDRMVILAPGDELRLEFDASALAPAPAGWSRTVFLESLGWDKDADRNTYAAQQLEPLPFRAMSGYPYGPDEAYPDTPLHRAYRATWLTRVIGAEPPRVGTITATASHE